MIKGAIAFVILAAGSLFSQIPVHDFWFWATLYLLAYRNFIGSTIEGMPEPTEKSSDGYVWAYRALHAMDRRYSPYRLPKSFWKIFEYRERDKDA